MSPIPVGVKGQHRLMRRMVTVTWEEGCFPGTPFETPHCYKLQLPLKSRDHLKTLSHRPQRRLPQSSCPVALHLGCSTRAEEWTFKNICLSCAQGFG